MFDRNFLISLSLAFFLIFAYNTYYQMRFGDYLNQQSEKIALDMEAKKRLKQAGQLAEGAAEAPAAQAPEAIAPQAIAPEAESEDFEPLSSGPASAPEVTADMKEASKATDHSRDLLTVDTGLTKVTISPKGAVLKSYKLNGLLNTEGKTVELVIDQAKFEKEQAEKLAQAREDGDEDEFYHVDVYPTLGLKFKKDDFSKLVNNAVFSHDAPASFIDLQGGGDPLTITFTFNETYSGVVIKKIYRFHPGEYTFDFTVEVMADPKWGKFAYSVVWFGVYDDEPANLQYLSYHRPIIKIGDKFHMESPDKEKKIREYQGKLAWSSFTHKYYAVIATPENKDGALVRTTYIDDNNAALEWEYESGEANTSRIFLGPKRHDILDKFPEEQNIVIDYGWFNVIAWPLFRLLNIFHSMTGNWGWAIVLLTVLVKIVLFPLSQKGFRSMKKLQKLQPQMQKIQEIYKDDREKMNRELMAFYKDNKVNPAGGCLPIVLQMPVFIALYKVMYETIELKGAPFILWITDLTAMDPYYVTPLLMGVTMFLQQWMTPATGDPVQRKVMMLLPLVFTVMFLSFPSGLVLYWLVNNVLSIIQQWIINRESFDDENEKKQQPKTNKTKG